MENKQLILKHLREVVKLLDESGQQIGSVNQLFVRAGFSKQHASAFNTGSRTPDRESLTKLAKHYNLSLDYLLTGNPPVLLGGEEVAEDAAVYQAKIKDPCRPIVDQMSSRIEDLHKLITHLEKRISDKDKIIALLEGHR